MNRPSTRACSIAWMAASLAYPQPGRGQDVYRSTPRATATAQGQGQPRAPRTPSRYEVVLIQSLQNNPATAPYLFATEWKSGKVVLHGRVGTKSIHDAAIQTAIGLGVPVVDALVIDTAAAHDAEAWRQYQQQAQQAGHGAGTGTALAGAGYGGQSFGPPNAGAGGLGSKGYPGTGGAAASLENQGGGNVTSPGANYGAGGGYGGGGGGYGGGGGGYGGGYGGGGGALPGAGTYGSLPVTYPPPLFGRLDDPFFGFEPPPIAYPPWWNAMTARRLGLAAYPMPLGAISNALPASNGGNSGGGGMGYANGAMPFNNGASINPNQMQGQGQVQGQGQMQAQPRGGSGDAQAQGTPAEIPYGTIDMVIDGRGSATIRGTVPTVAERVAIGQQLARTPGIAQVVNLLSVGPAPAKDATKDGDPGKGQGESTPPPPSPEATDALPQFKPAAPAEEPAPATPAIDPDSASRRASKAVTGRAGPGAQVKVRDGVASLTGKVPTVLEAMLAYRAAQQTPGVRQVDDRLEFTVPDGNGPNPLADKGRPEDVEPYLEAQIRRQVGDLAHIDRVRVQGDALDLKGTLARADDRARFDAILRSMPILRGFRLNADVPLEAP